MQVLRKADASYILGTCHKAKGTEEDYVQLANDFYHLHEGMPTLEELQRIHTLRDEYNLVSCCVCVSFMKYASLLNTK